ncbi:YidC/Oxa1 family membrane protein insertase [Cellulosilyticum ruminicola]|uniref:YidC/Oxa1 family membrane protein insertase n=1 Tax=Cellulosilyticum ruminicola TaxID=425254 RepID=UPI0006D173EB|nr:YidC/Oxa1 family membrane protein insertase [Cellulosilyticum ruminicola]
MSLINQFFGAILNVIFEGVTLISPEAALGISIILFTLVARVLMTPLQLSSQRTSRGMSKIQPEMQRIQNKYKDKKDQQSQMQMSQEMQVLYKKYKINPFAGCLPLLIQFPLIIALFNVLRTPAQYINKLTNVYHQMAEIVTINIANYQSLLQPFADSVYVNSRQQYDLSQVDGVSQFLSHLTTTQWNEFLQSAGNVPGLDQIFQLKHSYETFLTMNVVDTPKLLISSGMWLAILVPIIAGASTYIFSKITMSANGAVQSTASSEQNPAESMMKTMNIVMPVMTAFMSYTMPIGLALYWISGNVIMMGQQWVVNKMLAKQDEKMEAQLKKDREEASKNGRVTTRKVRKRVPVQKTDNTDQDNLK